MTIQDFIVRFGPLTHDVYSVSVDCPSGRAGGFFRIPDLATDGETEQRADVRGPRRDLMGPVTATAPGTEVEKAGACLFRALFSGPIRSLFDQAMGALAADETIGLRLRLGFDPESEGHARLLELPWEQLYWLERRQFLGLDLRISIVRVLAVPHRRKTLHAQQPIEVLLLAANPEDTGSLAWRQDCQKIVRALGNHPAIDTEPLQNATSPALGDRLRRGGLHILHFIGHGSFDPIRGQGSLILESESGVSAHLEAPRLADLCRAAPELRLVVLSACHTAEAPSEAGQDAFAGLTSALLMAGIPAVVSMIGPISDTAAIAFNEAFYSSLGRGRPIERAVIEGRLAIRANDGTAFEWTAPVLSMDAPERRLFDFGEHNSTSGVFPLSKIAAEPRAKTPRQDTDAGGPPTRRRAERSFSWLHLSDLHLGSRSVPETRLALDSLIKDLGQQMERDQLELDAVFVTGDIAWSGQPSEYELAQGFFAELLDTLGLPATRLFLVPGNHDVDWSQISSGAKALGETLQSREQVLEVLENATDRQLLLSRLKGYHQHMMALGGAPDSEDESLGYAHTFELQGWRIAVLGLDSAWLSAPGDDRARGLLLGEWQVRRLLAETRDADLRIALVHHPFDFLREFDRNVCEDLLTSGTNFILHGHLHRPAIRRLESPDSGAMVIAGGATWESQSAVNAYNLVSLDLPAGLGDITMRRYSDRGSGFWAPDTLLYENAPGGTFGFQFRPPEETPEPESEDPAAARAEPGSSDDASTRNSQSSAGGPAIRRSGFPDMLKWHNLMRHIRHGSCTPILGPGLSESLLGSRREAARLWAASHDYPLGPLDHVDLPQIAQYLSVQEDEDFMRGELADFLRRQLRERHGPLPEGESQHEVPLHDLLCRLGERTILPAFEVLASLPFPVYVCGDATGLLERALERQGKKPRVEVGTRTEQFPEPETIFDREPDYVPSVEEPLVYYLFGHLRQPDSLVLTEDNYFDFLVHQARSSSAIPGAVKSPLSQTALLFLGFELHAWDFRVLFRSLIRQPGDSRRAQYPHVAVQLNPMGDQVIDEERARSYLERYFYTNAAITIYWGEVGHFVHQLGERWEASR